LQPTEEDKFILAFPANLRPVGQSKLKIFFLLAFLRIRLLQTFWSCFQNPLCFFNEFYMYRCIGRYLFFFDLLINLLMSKTKKVYLLSFWILFLIFSIYRSNLLSFFLLFHSCLIVPFMKRGGEGDHWRVQPLLQLLQHIPPVGDHPEARGYTVCCGTCA
jgi:hypothetical protein